MVRLKKILKKTLLSILLLTVPLIMYYLDDYNIGLISFIIVLLFLLWAFDVNTFNNLSFDLAQKKIEMTRNVEETKKIVNQVELTANEVEVTANAFSKTIKACMDLNLVDMQGKGRFAMGTPWEDAAKFVVEATKLAGFLGDDIGETADLIRKAKLQVIDFFKSDAPYYFGERIDFGEFVKSGITVDNGKLLFDSESVAVDFDGLYELEAQAIEDRKLLWKQNVKRLEEFYKKNFK